MPVVWVPGNAGLVGVHARTAMDEGNRLFVLPAAAFYAGVIGGEAILPIERVVFNASLIGVDTS